MQTHTSLHQEFEAINNVPLGARTEEQRARRRELKDALLSCHYSRRGCGYRYGEL